jgi:hypothetical protein
MKRKERRIRRQESTIPYGMYPRRFGCEECGVSYMNVTDGFVLFCCSSGSAGMRILTPVRIPDDSEVSVGR